MLPGKDDKEENETAIPAVIPKKRKISLASYMPDSIEKSLEKAQGMSQEEKDRRAYALRKEGYSYQDIAARMGWASPTTAQEAALRAQKEVVLEQTEEIRQLQYDRLNNLVNAHWDRAMECNPQSSKIVNETLAQINKLMGLDKQVDQKITHEYTGHVVIGGDSEEYVRTLRNFIAAKAQAEIAPAELEATIDDE